MSAEGFPQVKVNIEHQWQGRVPGAGPSACMVAAWAGALGVDVVWLYHKGVEAGCIRARDAWILSHHDLIGLTGRDPKMSYISVNPDPEKAEGFIHDRIMDGQALHCRVSGHSMVLYGYEDREDGRYWLIDDVGRKNPSDGDTHAGPIHVKLQAYHDLRNGEIDRGWPMYRAKDDGSLGSSIRPGRPLWRIYAPGGLG